MRSRTLVPIVVGSLCYAFVFALLCSMPFLVLQSSDLE